MEELHILFTPNIEHKKVFPNVCCRVSKWEENYLMMA